MAQFKPYKVLSTQLSSLPIVEGQLVIVTDTQEIYLDSKAGRILISSADTNVVISDTEPTGQNAGDLWLILTED